MGDADYIVVGAGIVGLATAWTVLQRQPGAHVLVLDKEGEPAKHQSGHNSGVVHAGVYYKPGSYKATLCVKGSRMMIDFCREHGVPVRQSGKLVVAVAQHELERLDELERRTQANGLQGVRRLGPDQIPEVEPHAVGLAALHVPTTGAVDYAEVTRTLRRLVEAAGAEVRLGVEVAAVGSVSGRAAFRTTAGETLDATRAIVCAGLQADRLAKGAPGIEGLRVVPFRGGYFDLVPEAASLVRSMIYPVPDPAFPFLGVHFTRHIDETVSLGPNAVPAFKRECYDRWGFRGQDVLDTFGFAGTWRLYKRYWRMGMREVADDLSRSRYVRMAQRYIPAVEERHVVKGHVGVRAQVVRRDGSLVDDFTMIDHGPVVHVLNAPSPAATASLAIGEVLADRLLGQPAA